MQGQGSRTDSYHDGHFPTTRWSMVVLAAREEATPECRRALASLCGSYWDPLYVFARRMGYSVEDAKDLTQGFFALLLEKNYLQDSDRERGRFRSFLLVAFKRYAANQYDLAHAQKRGGQQTVLSIDAGPAEEWYRAEPADNRTPDRVFELRWALTVLDRALARLREEYASPEKREYFDRLQGALTGDPHLLPYGEIAAALHTSEGAVRVAAHRLRQRFRKCLQMEVGETVADPKEIDGEIQFLVEVLSTRS